MCRARCALGSATTTTVASRTIMSWATAMIARVQYRLGSGTVSSNGALLSRTSVVITLFLPTWLALRGGQNTRKLAKLWTQTDLNRNYGSGYKTTIVTMVPFVNTIVWRSRDSGSPGHPRRGRRESVLSTRHFRAPRVTPHAR